MRRDAKKGNVVVNFKYPLRTSGFFSHPDLTNESPEMVSENYVLLDQISPCATRAHVPLRFGDHSHLPSPNKMKEMETKTTRDFV